MPAIVDRARQTHEQRLRLVVGVIAFAFLCSLGAANAAPVEATNWSRQIAGTRAGQVAYENSMRAADREISSLKRARKQTQRTLRKTRRSLRVAIARRVETKRRMIATRSQLGTARRALVTSMAEPPPPPDTATAILALNEMAADPTTEDSAPVHIEDADLGFLSADVRIAPLPALATDASIGDVGDVGDVVALEQQLKRQKRTFQKARRRAARVSRNVRIKRNSLASIKARQRSATARREGAEAALGSRILSMSQLAQRRVAKKTSVRPGINSGFTWPTRGRISQTYGCTGFRLNPPRGSCRHFHDGLDITGYRGTPIRAAAVGVVSYIGWNPWDQNGRAFMIVVAHPGGYETLYGHVLPTRRVRVGQLVHRGEVIGYMGNTGRSTGVHLHFELRRGRTTLNPLAFL